MSNQKLSCKAAVLRIAIILLLLNTDCINQKIDWRESLWLKNFPGAHHFRQVPADSQIDDHTHLFVVENQKDCLGYIIEKQVTSRSGPFNILVFIDSDGNIKQTFVLNYPHQQGRGVRSEKFNSQFKQKGPDDPIRLDEDINAISGATISSQAMTRGVREAVNLIHQKFIQ